jgi:hypothetical protein
LVATQRRQPSLDLARNDYQTSGVIVPLEIVFAGVQLASRCGHTGIVVVETPTVYKPIAEAPIFRRVTKCFAYLSPGLQIYSFSSRNAMSRENKAIAEEFKK